VSKPGGDLDALIIGSGPNGLVAACVLARAGFKVLVLEAHPSRAGGAVGSKEATLPGYVHDVGAAFFPWGTLSPAFRSLQLERFNLRWRHADFESCHPAPDGSYACISRGNGVVTEHFGNKADGERWAGMVRWYQAIEPELIQLLLRIFPTLSTVGRLGPQTLARLAPVFLSRGRDLSARWFTSQAVRRVLPCLALHVDVGPDDRFGAALGFMLGMTATTGGYAVPEGGARSITEALISCLTTFHGQVRLGCRVSRIVVRDRQAVAVRLTSGEEISARAVLADTDVAALFLDLLNPEDAPPRVSHVYAAIPSRMGYVQGGLGTRWSSTLGGRAGSPQCGGPRRR